MVVDNRQFAEQVIEVLTNVEFNQIPSVLIVEDSGTISKILKRAFDSKGYHADIAINAHNAEKMFDTKSYDVAVIDYLLPDNMGDTLLDIFHKQQPECICLMMTTDSNPDLALNWIKRGASAYIRKPFEPEYLIELCARARRERSLSFVHDMLDIRSRELQQAEEKYTTLFREMLDGFALHEIICDENQKPIDYKFLAVNPAFENMTGLKGDDIVGKRILEILPATEKYWIEIYGKVTLTGEPARFDNYSSEIDKYFDVTAFRTAPKQFACIFSDITERKHAEDALRRSREQFELAINGSNDGIWDWDLRDNSLFLSPKWKEQLGYKDDELPNKFETFGDNIHLDDKEDVFNYVNRYLKGEMDNYSMELRMRRKDGSYCWILARGAAIRDENGIPLRMAGSHTDITQRKLAEQEKEKLQAQLNQAQKMESIGRLAGGVAHDLNNMLSVILGNAEVAMDRVEPSSLLFDDLKEIYQAATRSANLTRQLLAFARKQTIYPREVDLNEIVKDMFKMLGRIIGEDIALKLNLKEGLWTIKVDPSQIDQILANLCVNARDAINGVGNLIIETDNALLDKTCYIEQACNTDYPGVIEGDYVHLRVSDDGCGMDKETLENIFEPFFTTKELGKGTGLGLATVYGIVKQNNGFINVDSQEGVGTTFNIYLPRYIEKKQAIEDKNVSAKKSLNSLIGAKQDSEQKDQKETKTILIVEDEMAILKLTKLILESEGYKALAVSRPIEAIDAANRHSGIIDLIITDVVMPEMNGQELSKAILKIYPDINRLFMSGYTPDVIARQGVLDAGVNFIQKPFSKQDLIDKVKSVLSS
ncbi:MAG: response regulator [Desulfamplus sp.]|nr:response regulator [Desulfamplus sp.]